MMTQDQLRAEIKKGFAKLEELEAAHEEAMDASDANPSDEADEREARAYKEMWDAYMTLARQLSEFSGIEAKTTRAMICTKRAELKRLFAA